MVILIYFVDPRLYASKFLVFPSSLEFRHSPQSSHFIFEHFVLISHSNKIRDRARFGSQLNIDNRRERFALKGEKSLQSYIVYIYKQFTYVHTHTYI